MFFRPKVFTEYGFAISNKFWFYSDSLKKNSQVLIFCWWLPLLVKIDSFIFEVIIENYSQKSQKKNSFCDNWPYQLISITYCGIF